MGSPNAADILFLAYRLRKNHAHVGRAIFCSRGLSHSDCIRVCGAGRVSSINLSFLLGDFWLKIPRKALMFSFVMSIVFALCHGALLEPSYLLYEPVSRVTFESDKDRNAFLEGKIIYDLDRYLLLLIADKFIVSIPHEKIKSIETPPLKKSDLEEIRSRNL
jgi:hypothetical protein